MHIIYTYSLCSRNIQNMKLSLDFVEIWSIYCHSDFTWNQIWQIQTDQNVIFGKFRDFELWILVILRLEKWLKFTKIEMQKL